MAEGALMARVCAVGCHVSDHGQCAYADGWALLILGDADHNGIIERH